MAARKKKAAKKTSATAKRGRSAKSAGTKLQQARILLDALIGRASYDKAFVKELKSDPQRALGSRGMLNDKTSVEKLQKSKPKEFDAIAGAMIDALGDDFWAQVGVMASTCDPVPVTGTRRRR